MGFLRGLLFGCELRHMLFQVPPRGTWRPRDPAESPQTAGQPHREPEPQDDQHGLDPGALAGVLLNHAHQGTESQ
ncbi:MAG: hypothetical protein KDB53_20270 [Planctomycetes bacterium]|nr:hypothetical protein [Planctomycetota bacterium]